MLGAKREEKIFKCHGADGRHGGEQRICGTRRFV